MNLRSRPWLVAAIVLLLAGIGWLAVALPAQRTQAAILRADPETILADPASRALAVAGGERVFAQACASCHGAAGKGDRTLGAPDLTDAEHLYGAGLVSEIEEIARHGIRSGDPRGWKLASMPAYARARPYKDEPLPSLTPAQIDDLTAFLVGLQGTAADPAAAQRGGSLYATTAGCWDCHGRNGAGDPAIGAPSLIDRATLYGQARADTYRSIAQGRSGSSPAFQRHLTAAQLRNVAVYIASLQPRSRERR